MAESGGLPTSQVQNNCILHLHSHFAIFSLTDSGVLIKHELDASTSWWRNAREPN